MLTRLIVLLTAILAANPTFAQEMDAPVQEVFHRSLVSIELGENSGSGFVISEDGHILTAWHVLANLTRRSDGFIRTRFKVHLNVAGQENCVVRSRLVGASEYRDVAVLQIMPWAWKQRVKPSARHYNCLSALQPARLATNVGIAVEGEVGSAPVQQGLFDQRVWVLGRPAGCRERGEGNCIPKDFMASSRQVEREEDSEGFGLHSIHGQTVKGMSGGPVVLADGSVIAMTLASGKQEALNVMQALPAPSLARPLWTFGILHDGQSVGDYMEDMIRLMNLKDDIEKAIDMLHHLRNEYNKPEFVRQRLMTQKLGNSEITHVILVFKKRAEKVDTPAKFDLSIKCFPKTRPDFNIIDVKEDEHGKQAQVERARLDFPDVQIQPTEGREFGTLLPLSLEQIKVYCSQYLNKLSSVSGQSARFSEDDFVKLEVTPTATFDDRELEPHTLDAVTIDLVAGT